MCISLGADLGLARYCPEGIYSVEHFTEQKGVRPNSLASGDYTIQTEAKKGLETANFIRIHPDAGARSAWYLAWLLSGLAFAIVVALFFLLLRMQNGSLKRKNVELESAIAERTEYLNQLLEAMQDSEGELARQLHIQSRILASVTHDVRAPLKAVTFISSQIEKLIREEKYGMAIELGNAIGENTIRISNLLDDTLDYFRSQIKNREVSFEDINLYDLVSQKLNLFSLSLKRQGNESFNNVPLDLVVSNNSSLLGIIIGNLIDNANKNTYQGAINIYSEIVNGKLILLVSDMGSGVPDHVINWLSNGEEVTYDGRAQLLASGTSHPYEFDYLEEVHGVGLLIAKEIAVIIGVTLVAERTPKGSKIGVDFGVLMV